MISTVPCIEATAFRNGWVVEGYLRCTIRPSWRGTQCSTRLVCLKAMFLSSYLHSEAWNQFCPATISFLYHDLSLQSIIVRCTMPRLSAVSFYVYEAMRHWMSRVSILCLTPEDGVRNPNLNFHESEISFTQCPLSY